MLERSLLYLMTMKSSDYLARYVLLVLPIICSAVNYSHPSTPTIIVNIIIMTIAIINVIIIIIIVVIQSFSQHHHWPIIRSTVNHSLPNVWGYRTHQSYFLWKEKISRRNSHLFVETLSQVCHIGTVAWLLVVNDNLTIQLR